MPTTFAKKEMMINFFAEIFVKLSKPEANSSGSGDARIASPVNVNSQFGNFLLFDRCVRSASIKPRRDCVRSITNTVTSYTAAPSPPISATSSELIDAGILRKMTVAILEVKARA